MKVRRRLFGVVVVVIVVLIVASAVLLVPTSPPPSKKEVVREKNRIAVIETNMGIMEFELFEKRAPITTKNFIDLAQKGFYDGVTFHRIIHDFIVQGGDPTGSGSGGPGYTISDEFHPELKHDAVGILSMANYGPNTGGSQFFITLKPASHLDGHHAVFGRLVKGTDVLMRIGTVDTDENARPLEEVIMTKVTIKEPEE